MSRAESEPVVSVFEKSEVTAAASACSSFIMAINFERLVRIVPEYEENKSRDSLVGTATRLQAGQWRF
jgi:hypothetical protein